MVDYTTSKSGGNKVWLYLAVAVVVAVLLYALYAGSGTNTTADPVVSDPASITTPEAIVPEATAPDSTVPAVQ